MNASGAYVSDPWYVARGACRSINHIADVRTREVAEFEALKRANPHGNIRPPRRGDHAKLLAKDGADGIGLKKATPKPRRRLYGAEALALGHGVKLGAVPELLHDDPLIEVRVRCLRACCVCMCVNSNRVGTRGWLLRLSAFALGVGCHTHTPSPLLRGVGVSERVGVLELEPALMIAPGCSDTETAVVP